MKYENVQARTGERTQDGHGPIHVNLNKSGVDLASRVTIFNTVVFVLTNQIAISGVNGVYAPHLYLAVTCKKVMCNRTTKISV